jgi:hypothetical protein
MSLAERENTTTDVGLNRNTDQYNKDIRNEFSAMKLVAANLNGMNENKEYIVRSDSESLRLTLPGFCPCKS